MPEQVQLLNVAKVPQILANGQIMTFTEITYSALGVPIRRLLIPESQDTEEGRARAIAEDLKAARVTEPTRLNIPDV